MMKVFLALCAAVICAAPAVAGYKLGDEVADFKLKNVDSTTVSLTDYTTSRGVMVVFTSNNCQQSMWYEDRILELARKLAVIGWKTIAINPCSTNDGPDESMEGNLKRVEEKTYEFPYLRDETQEVARQFGVAMVPAVYLLRCLGTTYEIAYIGSIDDAPDPSKKIHNRYVEMNVACINANVKSDTPMSKVSGCTIKWKK